MTIAGPAQIQEMYKAILQKAMDGVMETRAERAHREDEAGFD